MVEYNTVPEVMSLDTLYSTADIVSQRKRYQNILSQFTLVYNKAARFLARAPGRVNIIGEHIDYCGFGVLPMGIERDIVIAVATDELVCMGEIVLELSSTNPAKFPTRHVSYNEDNVNYSTHDWSNYCQAGLQGVINYIKQSESNSLKMKKMSMLVDGTLPGGGGLSSSSALICCVIMAITQAQGIALDPVTLASLAVQSERLVGVNGGGMDQSCSMLAEKGTALYINFLPVISTERVKLPEVGFVIANSLVVSDKVVSAPTCYNLRVVETKMAADILLKKLDLTITQTHPTLRDLVDSINPDLELGIEGLLVKIESELEYQEEGYSIDQVCQSLDTSEFNINKRYLSEYPIEANTFHLYKRAKHVLTEALRVIRFKSHCDQLTNNTSSHENIINRLANLMNQSHTSCQKLFDCSCPELDKLVQTCINGGALASRLTGAGWGGCTISMVPKHHIEEFITHLKREYYQGFTQGEFDKVVFATVPSQGAVFILNTNSII